MNRRNLVVAAAAVAAQLALGDARGASTVVKPGGKPSDDGPSGRPFTIGMLAFDMMTNQDFVGPFDVFSRVRSARSIILGKTLDPVTTDSRYRMLPDVRLADAPELDIVFVPGGPGTTALMEDPEVIAFLRDRAPRAQWVTSVCTGALVLGAAGLLKGYRATTHWAAMDILPILGAIPEKKRVVIDRNRVTGGGVTAGIDFGLTLVAKIWGEEQAKLIQLGSEYNPEPPFDAGSPDRVPELAARFREMTKGMIAARIAAAERVSKRL